MGAKQGSALSKDIKIRVSKGVRLPIKEVQQPAIVQVGIPMDDEKSSSSHTDRRHQKTKRMLIGGVNMDTVTKPKEAPYQNQIQSQHTKQSSLVTYVEALKDLEEGSNSPSKDSRLLNSIYGARQLGSSFAGSQISTNSPLKAGQKYDKIVHSQKQQSLARLTNPNIHENFESSPDDDFYEDSPVQVREVHHQYPYAPAIRPFDLLQASIHQQQPLVSASTNFQPTIHSGMGFMGSQLHQAASNNSKTTPYSKGVKRQHGPQQPLQPNPALAFAQQTMQSNKFSGQLFHYAKTQYKMKLMTTTTYNGFQQNQGGGNAYQFIQPIAMDQIGDPSALQNEEDPHGGCGPPTLNTPSQNHNAHENLLRQTGNHSALDDLSTNHLMMKSDRNSVQTLPTSLSQKKTNMVQMPPQQQMTPNIYQNKQKLAHHQSTAIQYGESISGQSTMVPNLGPSHIPFTGGHSTALGWKNFSQVAYPNNALTGNNPITMPQSQMSKYGYSNNPQGSNFPDINNPQPVTAPGGKRSGRVTLGQRNDGAPHVLLQPGPHSYESTVGGPQQISNGSIVIPGNANTLILDQKGHATFYNNSPDMQALKAQHHQKLLNTDMKRKERVMLNKSQLRDGRPINVDSVAESGANKKVQNGQIMIPPPPFSMMSHQPSNVNNVIVHTNQVQSQIQQSPYKRSETVMALSSEQNPQVKNAQNSVDNFSTTINYMTNQFTRRPHLGAHVSVGNQARHHHHQQDC